MYDPNIKDFYQRVGRLKKAHAKGYGFEARGTLGRSAYYRKPRKNRAAMALPMVFLLVSAFALKGAIHYSVGAKTYENRVAALQNGEGFDKLGATLMTADPVTLWVSGTMSKHLVRRG